MCTLVKKKSKIFSSPAMKTAKNENQINFTTAMVVHTQTQTRLFSWWLAVSARLTAAAGPFPPQLWMPERNVFPFTLVRSGGGGASLAAVGDVLAACGCICMWAFVWRSARVLENPSSLLQAKPVRSTSSQRLAPWLSVSWSSCH